MSIQLFVTVLFAAALAVSCHSDSNIEETPPTPSTLLNEQVEGVYEGEFGCGGYGGPIVGWTWNNFPGVIELVAVGQDSLRLATDSGCLFTYRFVHDSVASVGKPHQSWVPNSPYGILQSREDSVYISVPRKSSYGWLGSEFRGKKK